MAQKQQQKPIICAVPVKDGSQCQIRVKKAGDRCPRHKRNFKLLNYGLTACKAVVAAGGAVSSIQTLHSVVWPWILQVSSFVFPEGFWYGGLNAAKSKRSKERAITLLETQLRKAEQNENFLLWKIDAYSEKQKRELESTFRTIIRKVQRLEDA
jgi:hypothetical protein